MASLDNAWREPAAPAAAYGPTTRPTPYCPAACDPAAGLGSGRDADGRARPARQLLLVDDHALLRLGLKALLGTERRDLEVFEAASLQDALDAYRREPGIELVLLDLNMADCRGLQGLRRFRNEFPQARMVVLSATQDEFVIRQAQALGAVAYIPKSLAPDTMSRLVLGLLQRLADAAMADGAMPGWQFPPLARNGRYDRVAELGARHLEILDFVLFGCSNQEISNATGLSLGTIKNYVSTILLALDVKSRSHLISLFR